MHNLEDGHNHDNIHYDESITEVKIHSQLFMVLQGVFTAAQQLKRFSIDIHNSHHTCRRCELGLLLLP